MRLISTAKIYYICQNNKYIGMNVEIPLDFNGISIQSIDVFYCNISPECLLDYYGVVVLAVVGGVKEGDGGFVGEGGF